MHVPGFVARFVDVPDVDCNINGVSDTSVLSFGMTPSAGAFASYAFTITPPSVRSFKMQPDSAILPSERAVTLKRHTDESRYGVTLNQVAYRLYVVSVAAGTAAHRAGLQFGDEVVYINGCLTCGWSAAAAADFMGESELACTMVVRRTPFMRLYAMTRSAPGAPLGMVYEHGVTVQILPGLPAHTAGMGVSEQIVRVGGRNAVGLDDEAILALLRCDVTHVLVATLPVDVVEGMTEGLDLAQVAAEMP